MAFKQKPAATLALKKPTLGCDVYYQMIAVIIIVITGPQNGFPHEEFYIDSFPFLFYQTQFHDVSVTFNQSTLRHD